MRVISAHNQVRDAIASFPTATLRLEWTLFEETHVAKTGALIDDDVDRLGRRQLDWILESKEHKRIASVDLCRPTDVHQTQLLAAAIRKQTAYRPLVEGLSFYTEQGWVVHVFPLVVGIRGMIHYSHVQSLLKSLDIQRKHWEVVIDQTALASVRAFHFLHKVRFGGPLERVQLDIDPNSISSASKDDASKNKYSNQEEAPNHQQALHW